MKKIFIIVICLIGLVSCQKFVSGVRFDNDYIVVSAILYGGELITKENPVFIGKTIDVNGGNLMEFVYYDAIVKIQENDTDNIIELEFFGDETGFGYYDSTNSFFIEHGKTYILTAVTQDGTVTAITTVPETFEILPNLGFSTVTDSFPKMKYDDIDILYSLVVSVNELKEHILYEEYYCLEEWNNAYFIQDLYAPEKPESQSDYEDVMTGFPRKNISYYKFYPRQENDMLVIKVPFVKASFMFYGKHRVRLSLIDDNYYHYLYKTQGYFQGGIDKGIGYFGSASRIDLFTEIVK